MFYRLENKPLKCNKTRTWDCISLFSWHRRRHGNFLAPFVNVGIIPLNRAIFVFNFPIGGIAPINFEILGIASVNYFKSARPDLTPVYTSIIFPKTYVNYFLKYQMCFRFSYHFVRKFGRFGILHIIIISYTTSKLMLERNVSFAYAWVFAAFHNYFLHIQWWYFEFTHSIILWNVTFSRY